MIKYNLENSEFGDYTSHAASAGVHFTEASIDHANIQSIGSATHTEIDSHIASAGVHFIEGSIVHDNLSAVDSGTYRHLSAAQVTDLTDGNDTTLHDHDGISENTTHRGSDGADHSRVVTNSAHVSGVGDDHTQYVLADGSRDITGNQTFEAGVTLDTQPSGVDQAVPRNYIESRLQNLITNGSGLLESNYNFVTFTFDPAETHGGGGSFLHAGAYTGGKFGSELIPIDGDKFYRMVQWCMSGDTGGGNFNAANRQYSGLLPYDIDGLQISPWMYSRMAGSDPTTLAAEIQNGHTTITLTDASTWENAGATYERQIVWYGYENGKGYTYPDYTYTRNGSRNQAGYTTNGCWAAAGIAGNVITLTEPWSGGTVANGSAVRNCTSGGTYKYICLSNVNVPNVWTRYEGYIGGWDTNGSMSSILFPYGTAFVVPMWLPNYTDGTGNNFRFSDLWFSEMSARNLEDATNAVKGVATAAQITDLEANTSARHAESHTVLSHSDTTATGAELDTLTDNSIANTLHRHSELVASDGAPDPAFSIDATGLASFPTGTGINEFSTDDTLAGDSDNAVPTEQAVKAYVDAVVTSYDTGWINRNDWTNVHLGNIVLDYDNLSGPFTVGETITGGTTTDTGIIVSDTGSTLVLKDVTGGGIFLNNEEITGSISGETADVNEVSGDAKNQDQDVTHNLGVPLSDLIVRVLFSDDGTDATSFEQAPHVFAGPYGYTMFGVDDNNVKIQTGNQGMIFLLDTGASHTYVADDTYYKVKVFKL